VFAPFLIESMESTLTPLSPDPAQTRRIVLGVTGGVAAYKSVILAREWVRAGHLVDVVMTAAALHFIGRATFAAITGHAVWTDAWDERMPNTMAHIELSRGAYAIVVMPATADFMAKLAHGICDDLLTTLCAARRRHETLLAVAPAMNREMWENPANLRNIEQLRADGVLVWGPAEGEQACGEVGSGRVWEPHQIVEALAFAGLPKTLAGRRVLVTAGPTEEAVDPVRVLTNRSSGRMGFAIARAAAGAGATVTLVAGPTPLATPLGVERVDVTTADQMAAAVLARAQGSDIFFAVAAVADYRPAAPAAAKIKKSSASLTLTLEPTTDILKTVAALPSPPYCVGFAAETHDVLAYARAKRLAKRLPIIVANQATTAIGAERNAVTLIEDGGETNLAEAPKDVIAQAIVDHVAARLAANPFSH
jgi:phosphopantothenoylcysteine decarboxylase / phosphopantothenate---cysteine ligase